MPEKVNFLCTRLKDTPRLEDYDVPGCVVKMMCSEQTPTNSLIAGIVTLEPSAKIPLHYHNVEELQYIPYGSGIVRDAARKEYEISAESVIYCNAGPEGAHEFENNTELPMAILWIYPSPGGKFPTMNYVGEK